MTRRIWSFSLWIGVITASLLLRQTSCTVGQDLMLQQAAYTQKKGPKDLAPEYKIYHYSVDSSTLYFRIPFSQLTTRTDKKGQTQVAMRLSYRLLEHKKNVLDSGSVFLSDSTQDLHPSFLEGSLSFQSKALVGASLQLTLTDAVSSAKTNAIIRIDQGQNWNEQYFLWFDSYAEKPIFSAYLPAEACKQLPGLTLRSEASSIQKLHIRHYPLAKLLPAPPFSVETQKPSLPICDSLFIRETKDKYFCSVFEKQGIYTISPDSSASYGTSLFAFGPDFPIMHSEESMLEPLRFLCTSSEFNKLESSTEEINRVNVFWLRIGGNEARGKELKRRFYERIAESNRFFSSFVEGWRTDRGMIYLLFGPPDRVERKENMEIWTYNAVPSTYVFRKVESPFHVSQWILDRSEIYREQWYSMVKNWREGRIAN